MNGLLLLAVFTAVTPPALADVYKCIQDGKTVYQSQPCKTGGYPIDATPASGYGSPSPAGGYPTGSTAKSAPSQPASQPSRNVPDSTSSSPSESGERLRKDVSAMERDRLMRNLDYQIRASEQDISNYQAAMNRELYVLSNRRVSGDDAAAWRQSNMMEMQAVTQKYSVQIQATQARINMLRQQAMTMQMKEDARAPAQR